jgi:salicylate hydroxylase
VVAFPIEKGSLVSIVANVGDRSKPLAERVWDGPWVRPGDRAEMLGQFAGWDERVLGLLKVCVPPTSAGVADKCAQTIAKPEKWAMFDLEPLERWTAGRVTLLGDAAHASVPYNGAGAGQAIEDAYVLGALLALPECTKETLPVFLQAYEDARKPRACEQQRHALRTGDVYQFAGEPGGDYVRMGEDLHERFKWIWEHDLETDVEAAKEKLRAADVLHL